jgi:molybdopterin-guanine dinucleotide biosynthesis protein A
MGSDKRALLVDGEPLLRRVLRAVSTVADELVVVDSDRSRLPPALLSDMQARVVRDAWPDAGPLAGIEAGLRASTAPIAVVVAADAPWLESRLLRLLADELAGAPTSAAAAVESDRGPQPLVAAYRSEVAGVARTLLETGERRLGALLDAISVRSVDASVWRAVDPSGRSLRNLNRARDVRSLLQADLPG